MATTRRKNKAITVISCLRQNPFAYVVFTVVMVLAGLVVIEATNESVPAITISMNGGCSTREYCNNINECRK